MADASGEKKILVDEDWKKKVEQERETLKHEPSPGEREARAAQLPPASFSMLVTTLMTEALAALGQFPHPGTGKAEVDREQAKYFIDTLEVLQEKTRGNLEPDEMEGLEGVLHQLRLAYVVASKAPAQENAGTARQAANSGLG